MAAQGGVISRTENQLSREGKREPRSCRGGGWGHRAGKETSVSSLTEGQVANKPPEPGNIFCPRASFVPSSLLAVNKEGFEEQQRFPETSPTFPPSVFLLSR